jgi:homoserine O-acetyltransferase
VVGPGRGLDLNRWRVLAFDFLAGPGGSSAPERPTEPGVIPPLTPADQAGALRAVADHLELGVLEAVMGASYGGAVALSFAADHADRTRAALVIGAAHRSHPLATALRVVQRRIVQDAMARGDEREGLALARVLAMTTYRSQEEFQRRFSGRPSIGPEGPRFPVEDYLDYHGQVFADRFDAMGFLCLSLSMDLHQVDPAAVRAPVTLVAMEPDSIAPAWQVRQLAEQLGSGHELIEVPATCGHDSFLTDVGTFSEVVRTFLERRLTSG